MLGKHSFESLELEALALEVELLLLQTNFSQASDTGVVMVSIDKIQLAHDLFQNRAEKFSEESVKRIINAVENGSFKWAMLDPVTLWENPDNGKIYMLSGHSRLEAFVRLKARKVRVDGKVFDFIPAKFFHGSLAEAKEVALNSNTLSTKETNLERAKYYRSLRSSGMSKKEVREKAESLEGKNANLIIALSYLNPNGKAIQALKNLEQGEETSKQIIQTVTYWLGEARKAYFDELTNSHEDELYDWLINSAYGTKAGQITRKNDFLAAIEKAIMRNAEFGVFDKSKPLNMNRSTQKSPVELQYEQLILDAQKEVSEAKKARDQKLRYFTSQTTDRKKITEALQEYDNRLRRAEIELQALLAKKDSILDAAKNQTSLFGIEYLSSREAAKLEALDLGKAEGKSVYDIITEKLIKEIEAHKELFWQSPFRSFNYGPPKNFATGRTYRGINYIFLQFIAQRSNPYWMTFKQVEQLKGKIKKGAQSEIVFFYTKETVSTKKQNNPDGSVTTVKQITELDYPVIKFYRVFNGEDIEGIDFKLPPKPAPRTDAEAIDSCEAIISNMPQIPAIYHDQDDQAIYRPALDTVHMPLMAKMKSDTEYYSALFHELVHSTGHKSRLDRFSKQKSFEKTGASYAFEELVAELGASFLCGDAGILYFTLKNSAAYLKGWKEKLISIMKKDDRFFLKAAAAAEAAATFINPPREEIQNVSSETDYDLILDATALELELQLLNF